MRMLTNLLMVAIFAPVFAVESLRLCSWNLRYDSKPDNLTVEQSLAQLRPALQAPVYYDNVTLERPWSTRRVLAWQTLVEQELDVICFQEALIRQVNDLKSLLGPNWAWVGVGRDDGVQKGEYNPIFYDTNKFNLLGWDTFWLSDTPNFPSKYPGAGSYRLCEVAKFSAKSSGTQFTVMNTHLDDQSDAQRRLGASLVLTRARYEEYSTNVPLFLTGDFNSPPSGRDSGAYQIAVGSAAPVAINASFATKYSVPSSAPSFTLLDLRAETSLANIRGNYATFTGFSALGKSSVLGRIDFIFGGSNHNWQSEGYKVGETISDDGVYSSDHRPVFAQISIPTS